MINDPQYIETLLGTAADRMIIPDLAQVFAADGLTNLLTFNAIALSAQETAKLCTGTFITADDDDSKIDDMQMPCEAELVDGSKVIVVAARLEIEEGSGTVSGVKFDCLKVPLPVVPTKDDVVYIKESDMRGWRDHRAMLEPDRAALDKFFKSAEDYGKSSHRLASVQDIHAYVGGKGPSYLTKVQRTMDTLEAKEIKALSIVHKGDKKGLNTAREEMVKQIEPLRDALESKSPFLGAAIHERVIFISKVAAEEDVEKEAAKVLEQQIK